MSAARCTECMTPYRPEPLPSRVADALVEELKAGLLVRGGYTVTEELAEERARNMADRLAYLFHVSFQPDVCAVCTQLMPGNDRLPFGPGRFAHAACVMRQQTKEVARARR